MHLAGILPRLEIIAVQIAAVHPVRHPDHVVVPVHGQSAHLDLPRFGVPVDRTLPFQVVRIVNGDLNVLALAVFESLDTGIQLAVPHVDIAQVIGFERQSFERVFVFGDQPPLLVILVERRAARNVIIVRVGGDSLPSFDRNDPFEPILPAEALRPECRAGRHERQHKKNSFHHSRTILHIRTRAKTRPETPTRFKGFVSGLFSAVHSAVRTLRAGSDRSGQFQSGPVSSRRLPVRELLAFGPLLGLLLTHQLLVALLEFRFLAFRLPRGIGLHHGMNLLVVHDAADDERLPDREEV